MVFVENHSSTMYSLTYQLQKLALPLHGRMSAVYPGSRHVVHLDTVFCACYVVLAELLRPVTRTTFQRPWDVVHVAGLRSSGNTT
jgi:hypothetical protein